MAKNNKSKDFSLNNKGLDSPASVHEDLATTTQRIFTTDEIPRAIYCKADGNVVIKDAAGVTVTYPVSLGQILPFMGIEIEATTDIATVIWW
jgi:hypothetical protein